MSFTLGYDPALVWQEVPLVVVIDDKILVAADDEKWGFYHWQDLVILPVEIRCAHHLGYWQQQPVAVIELELPELVKAELALIGLRQLLDRVDADKFNLLGRALQLIHWRKTHRFCGQCGKPTLLSTRELCLLCGSCQHAFYPRIAPCVIGLVNRGRELLLAHHIRHKEPRYSLLAGFIEAGESAEQALVREVAEETGIVIDNVSYVTSQPWPFPSQLMLGFFAEYAEGEIVVDTAEIRDARWFNIDQLPLLPPPGTVAGNLIQRRVTQLRELENP